jgi:two-component system sensor histidine kinase CreC
MFLEDIRRRYQEAVEETLVDTAFILSSHLAERSANGGTLYLGDLRGMLDDVSSRELKAPIYDLVKTSVDIRVYVTDSAGYVLYDSDNGRDEGKDYSRWNDVYLTLQGRYGARATRTDPDDPKTSVMHVASPIMYKGELIGVLTVCKPVTAVNRFVDAAQRRIIIGGTVVGGVALLFAVLLTAWISRPIHQLTEYAKSVSSGQPATLPELGETEIGTMAQAMHEMREALEGKNYIEQYVQTLTHELKSPLSAIRGAAELLDEDMPADRRAQFLTNIREESSRMEMLVDRMLHLSSLERRSGLEDAKPMDVAALAHGVMDSVAPLIAAKNLQVTADLDTELPTVVGESFLVRQAIMNLVQNAIDFAPTGGELRVGVNDGDGSIRVVVHNDGAPIPDFAMDRIFERFYSLPREESGRKSSGLGLSFVKQVAQLHGGSVSLKNVEDGVVAELELKA